MNVMSSVWSGGYSVPGVNLLKAFDRLGRNPALFSIGEIDGNAWPEDHDLFRRATERAAFFDPDAPCLRVYHQWLMSESVGRGKRIGYTFAELDRLKPVEVHQLNSLDALLQPSQWAADVAAASGVTAKQVVVPCAVDTDIFWPESFPPGDETVFIVAGKLEYRKGHDLIRPIWEKAFSPAEKVRLILLCHNPFLTEAQHRQWWDYFGASPNRHQFEIIPGRVPSQRDVAAIFRRAHCGLFPARAEGFNLEAAELLAMGRHVVMTDYAGHTAYGREAGAWMVPVRGTEAASDGLWFNQLDPAWGGKPGGWALLDDKFIDEFAMAAWQIHEARRSGVLDLNQRGIDYFSGWTWDSAARRILDAVDGQ